MADITIPQLNAATSVSGTDVMVISQAGATKKVEVDKLTEKVLSSSVDVLHMNPNTVQTLANIGELAFNPDTQTLEVKCSADVTLSIGQENYIRGKNAEADTILNGTVVYVSGGLGANSLIKRAGNADSTAERVIGVATQDIGANNIGFITTSGVVNKLDTSAYAEGDLLWLGTNGAMTNVKPDTSVDQICIGVVLRSHATEGSILVSVKDDWRDQVAQLRSDLNKNVFYYITSNDITYNNQLLRIDGGVDSMENYYTSAYMEVNNQTLLKMRGAFNAGNWCAVVLYDASKTVIGYIQGDANALISKVRLGSINENVKFIRHSFIKAFGFSYVLLSDDHGVFKLFEDKIEEFDNTVKKVVAQDGSGDYTTLQSALDAITDNSKNKRYEILVRNGTYDLSDVSYLPIKNYVTIVGESRLGTIISSSSAIYQNERACFDAVGQNVEFARIENLTLKIHNGKCCIHSDTQDSIIDGGKIQFFNLHLLHSTITDYPLNRGGINVGLHSGQTIEIDGCTGNTSTYYHTPVNPTLVMNPSYFIVRNSQFKYISAYDISSLNKNYFIAENNKANYIGIGTSEIAIDNTKNTMQHQINNNQIDFVWGILDFSLWATKYPVCVNSIQKIVENKTANTILKNTFVSKQATYEMSGGQLAAIETIIPYDAVKGFFGYTMDDFAANESGVLQYRGILFIEMTANVGDWIALDTTGTPIIGTDSNAIGRVEAIRDDGKIAMRINLAQL